MKPRSAEPEEIIRAATRIFAEKGYADTKMSDIASELHISRKPLYYAFEDKEDLFINVAENYYRYYSGRQQRINSSDSDIFSKIKELLTADDSVFYEDHKEFYNGSNIMLDAKRYFSGNSRLETEIRNFRTISHESLKEAIRRAIDNGELTAASDPAALADMIHLFFYGYTSELGATVHNRDGSRMHECVDEFVDMIRSTYGANAD